MLRLAKNQNLKTFGNLGGAALDATKKIILGLEEENFWCSIHICCGNSVESKMSKAVAKSLIQIHRYVDISEQVLPLLQSNEPKIRDIAVRLFLRQGI